MANLPNVLTDDLRAEIIRQAFHLAWNGGDGEMPPAIAQLTSAESLQMLIENDIVLAGPMIQVIEARYPIKSDQAIPGDVVDWWMQLSDVNAEHDDRVDARSAETIHHLQEGIKSLLEK